MYSIEDIYRQALQDDTLYMERNNNDVGSNGNKGADNRIFCIV